MIKSQLRPHSKKTREPRPEGGRFSVLQRGILLDDKKNYINKMTKDM